MNISEYFEKLRFDDKHHLGLGDIRLTMAQQEEIIKENERLIETLLFYADPETYFAIGFFPDPPCGDFIRDFSETIALGRKPGKRAREVLGYTEVIE